MLAKNVNKRRDPIGAGILIVLLTIWIPLSNFQSLKNFVERLEFVLYDFRLNATLPDPKIIDDRIVAA